MRLNLFVDMVLSHRISDPDRFEYDMVNDIDMEMALKAHEDIQVVLKAPLGLA